MKIYPKTRVKIWEAVYRTAISNTTERDEFFIELEKIMDGNVKEVFSYEYQCCDIYYATSNRYGEPTLKCDRCGKTPMQSEVTRKEMIL